MALLSLHCGLRAGEIFNLKGHDLNFQHDVITVLDAKNMRPKKSYMTEAVKEMLSKRIPATPDSYIFTQRSGERYNEIPKLFREIADTLFNKHVKDNRQRVTFHTVRHTFASWGIISSISIIGQNAQSL